MTNFAEMINIGGLCSRLNYQLSSVQEQPVKSKRENSNLSVFLEIKPSFAILSTLTFFLCHRSVSPRQLQPGGLRQYPLSSWTVTVPVPFQ